MTQYVLLPSAGLTNAAAAASPAARAVLLGLHTKRTARGNASVAHALSNGNLPKVKLRVLDEIHEDGAKLIEADPESAALLRAQSGLRLVPVVWYQQMRAPRPRIASKPAATAASLKTTIAVVGSGPVAGATVIAFTDYANGVGVQGTTSNAGIVRLSLGAAKRIERLFVYPRMTYWSSLSLNAKAGTSITVTLRPIDLAWVDCVRRVLKQKANGLGEGVSVGIVDSGVALDHPDLTVAGGENTVLGETPGDFGDNGQDGHGTHVAGIVAAHGTAPTGIRGVAPNATLRSYRVFGKGSDGASNFSIAKAVDRAVADGCDLINLSLGGELSDPLTSAAIEAARAKGSVVLAAAGNDHHSPVSFPAADALAIAVSAAGRKGTFPTGTAESIDVKAPFGDPDRRDFFAAFSNRGGEIDVIGGGVGVISTVPGGHAVMSGTSMACPAVTGALARLLSDSPAILGRGRDASRSAAIAQVLLGASIPLGFGPPFSGKGLPRA